MCTSAKQTEKVMKERAKAKMEEARRHTGYSAPQEFPTELADVRNVFCLHLCACISDRERGGGRKGEKGRHGLLIIYSLAVTDV